MAEIADRTDALVGPLQQDEISGPARGVVGVANDQCRTSVDKAGRKLPVVDAGVIA